MGEADRAGGRLTLVVAWARGRVIGHNNALPWHLPEDLKHFRAVTMGHVLVMGRKTFDSIGRPLPGRQTVVVTRDPHWSQAGCERSGSLPEALETARALAAARGCEVLVVGGADLYRQALPLATDLIVTEIDADFAGDTVFPALPDGQWRELSRETASAANGLPYAIVRLTRTRG
jgi:dihydrofolate reductase